jgi:hypothetical protein
MKTKHLFLTAFAVLALVTASFSNIFSANDNTALKCYDDISYKVTDSTDGNNGGGPKIPPTGE